MNEEVTLKRVPGRKKSNTDKVIIKTITLYEKHFIIIDKNNIELSNFVRWLINKKQNKKINCDIEDRGKSIQTTISLYPKDVEKIEVNNLSCLIRYGLENYTNQYLK